MDDRAGFCVVNRFKVRPGLETEFEAAWLKLTKAYKRDRGGLGSRLHRAGDGLWVAYAQWPNKQMWEESRALGPPDTAAGQAMAQSVEERLDAILLEPVNDLLEPVPIKSQS